MQSPRARESVPPVATPAATHAFAPWPVFGEEEIDAVASVLRSGKVNYWTGEEVRLFEEEAARAFGCPYAVSVANGSVALELALHSLGIGPGDEVIVTARSFIASASCCVLRGAKPIFADVDPESQNVTAETIERALTPKTKAVIVVHLAGWPCEMDAIMDLADRRGLLVIEDCAQAHGATYHGRPVGSLGHAAAFSFCQDKILTTGGEGGLLVTKDRAVWERAWSYKDHGKDRDAVGRANPSGTFQWLHASIGTNWRLTEMQAAVGRVVLRKLPAWIAARRCHAATLDRRFANVDALRVGLPASHLGHAYYKYYAFLRPERLLPGWTRDRVVATLKAEGIPCGSGACSEIYREEAFRSAGLGPRQRLPVARRLGETSLMLPVHPTLTSENVHRLGAAVERVVRAATSSAATPRAA